MLKEEIRLKLIKTSEQTLPFGKDITGIQCQDLTAQKRKGFFIYDETIALGAGGGRLFFLYWLVFVKSLQRPFRIP